MKTKTNILIAAVSAASLFSTGNARAAAPFIDPAFFGQPNTTYQEWDGFSSPAGPNAPTSVSNPNGTPNWFDSTAASDGAFGIGSSAPYHIYSFSGSLNPQIDVPVPTLSGNATATLVLQAVVEGSTLDHTAFFATFPGFAGSPIAATTVNETDLGSTGSGFGGDSFYYRVEWDNVPAAASYSVAYTPNATSSSQVSARLDTLTAVPEPATASLMAAGLLLLGRRRRNRA